MCGMGYVRGCQTCVETCKVDLNPPEVFYFIYYKLCSHLPYLPVSVILLIFRQKSILHHHNTGGKHINTNLYKFPQI